MSQDEAPGVAETGVERRVALRRGAAVLAGVAGLGAVAATAIVPGVAGAAPGDPVAQGADNDAGTTTTGLTSSAGGGTLVTANTGAGAPLRVAPRVGVPPVTSQTGDVFSAAGASGAALPTYTHLSGTSDEDALWAFVYTDAWAVQPLGVTPQRALDTRTVAGRELVLDPAGKFDAAGRLLAGQTITLSLAPFAFGVGSVFANHTVTSSTGPGNLVLYPADPRPATSSLNFAAGQTIANFAFVGMKFAGDGSADENSVKIFTTTTVRVILDVTGFAVGSTDFISPEILPASAVAEPARINPATAPRWFRERWAQRHAR